MKNSMACLALVASLLAIFTFANCNGSGSAESNNATLSVTPEYQLDRNASIGAFAEDDSFAQLNNAAAFSFTLDITDTLGESHTMSVYFVHTGAQAWQVRLYAQPGDTTGTLTTPLLMDETDLLFNEDGTVFNAAAGGRVIVPNLFAEPTFANGAPSQGFTIFLSNGTEVDGASALVSIDETRR